jgi:hypothetical protein
MRGDLDLPNARPGGRAFENVRSWRANAKERLCEHTEAPTERGETLTRTKKYLIKTGIFPPSSSPPFPTLPHLLCLILFKFSLLCHCAVQCVSGCIEFPIIIWCRHDLPQIIGSGPYFVVGQVQSSSYHRWNEAEAVGYGSSRIAVLRQVAGAAHPFERTCRLRRQG